MTTPSTSAFRFQPIAYFVRDEFPFVRTCMDEAMRRFDAAEPVQAPALPDTRRRREQLVTCAKCGAEYLASHTTALKAQRTDAPVYCPLCRIMEYRTQQRPYYSFPKDAP